jgi:hypothetical protein
MKSVFDKYGFDYSKFDKDSIPDRDASELDEDDVFGGFLHSGMKPEDIVTDPGMRERYRKWLEKQDSAGR